MERGVAVLVASKWQEEATEVKRVSERIMSVRIRVGKRILCLVSVYAPQAGRAMVDKEEFYEALGEVLNGVKEEACSFVEISKVMLGGRRIRRGTWLSWCVRRLKEIKLILKFYPNCIKNLK